MPVHVVLARVVAVAATASMLSMASAGAASAVDPATAAANLGGGALYNAGHAIFLVKDLGGGAYWNVTTSTLYVLDTAGTLAVDTVITAATTGATLVATAADDGRGALLLVNGKVLVPVQHAVFGG